MAAGAILLLAVGAWFWTFRSATPATQNPEPKTLNSAASASPPAAAPVSAASQLAKKAAGILADHRSPTDLGTAQTLIEQALALDKSDAEIWAIGSEIRSARHQYGGADPTDELAAAQSMVSTARNLDRNSYEVRRAWAYFRQRSYVVQRDASMVAGLEGELRALDRERPGDPWTMMLLAWFLGMTRVDDSLPVFDEIAKLPGKNGGP